MITTEFNGVKLEGPDTAQGVIDEVCTQDVYRIGDIPQGSSVLDVGAHIGTFTCRCKVERACTVLALEPNPISRAWLQRNIQLNALEGGIEVEDCACGYPGGHRMFECNLDHPAGSGFKSDNLDGRIIEVPVTCVTLSSVMCSMHFDVLKLDCEGAEREIFSDPSLESALLGTRVVMMEWHNYDGLKYEDILRTFGFFTELTGGSLPDGGLTPYDKSMRGGMLYATR